MSGRMMMMLPCGGLKSGAACRWLVVQAPVASAINPMTKLRMKNAPASCVQ
jgi:hypothetical protein